MKFKNKNIPTGLYIHIPVCREKCSYCDFYSETGIDYKTQNSLVNSIKEQINYFTALAGNPDISTVYIGGGTPSIIHPDILTELLKFCETINTENPILERTIEANPESINESILKIFNKYGITRLSIGIQSFKDRLLKIIGRNTDSEYNFKALSLLKNIKNIEINTDLISGIPGQTPEDIKNDLNIVIDSGINHISLYSLTIPAGTDLDKKIMHGKIKRNQDEDELWLSACKILSENGYVQYEISNFAKPGNECRHNLAYWNMNPYIGAGPGAVSTIPGGRTGILRLNNYKNLRNFTKYKNIKKSYSTEEISKEDFLFENLMMGFRKKEGINSEIFQNRFGNTLNYFLGETWDKWKNENYADENDEFYFLTEKGRLFLNILLREAMGILKKPESVNWC